jgi:hypothetical protein
MKAALVIWLLSGGPLHVPEGPEERSVEDEELFPIGITFQGFPSSGREEANTRRGHRTCGALRT